MFVCSTTSPSPVGRGSSLTVDSSPISTRVTLGKSSRCSPAPYPTCSTCMRGMSPYPSTVAARMAAPVGVTSSNGTPREYIGAPRRSSTTAGAGIGIAPCSVLAMPNPVGTGDAKTRSTPSIDRASAVPVMSTMESIPPISWKVTSSTSLRCTRASASASRRKIRCAVRFTWSGSGASSRSVRMLEYVLITPATGASIWTFAARRPNDSTSSSSIA